MFFSFQTTCHFQDKTIFIQIASPISMCLSEQCRERNNIQRNERYFLPSQTYQAKKQFRRYHSDYFIVPPEPLLELFCAGSLNHNIERRLFQFDLSFNSPEAEGGLKWKKSIASKLYGSILIIDSRSFENDLLSMSK